MEGKGRKGGPQDWTKSKAADMVSWQVRRGLVVCCVRTALQVKIGSWELGAGRQFPNAPHSRQGTRSQAAQVK